MGLICFLLMLTLLGDLPVLWLFVCFLIVRVCVRVCVCVCVCVCARALLGLYLPHMEIPTLEAESALQLLATGTPDRSIYELHCSHSNAGS